MGQENGTMYMRTKYTNEILIASAELLERMAKVCRLTASGEHSMTDACKQEQLDYMRLRSVLQTKAFAACDLTGQLSSMESLSETSMQKPTAEEKLYMDLCGIKDTDCTEFPPDYKETLQAFINTLTEREKGILSMRYGLNGQLPMTLKEIGEEIGITSQRVSQIEKGTHRKLYMQFQKRRLMIGNAKWHAEQYMKEAEKDAYKENVQKWIDEEIQKIQEKAECMETNPKKISLDDMNLSVRSCNCLHLAEKKTLADLLTMDEDDFEGIPNIGKRSIEEIVAKRDEMGLRIFAYRRNLSWKGAHKENEQEQLEKEAEKKLRHEAMKICIEDMGLSLRTFKCLRRAGKRTLADIMDMDDEDFVKIRGLGRCGKEEVTAKRNAAVVKLEQGK